MGLPLRTAIGALLNDPVYSTAARHWAERFAAYDSGIHFGHFLQEAIPCGPLASPL